MSTDEAPVVGSKRKLSLVVGLTKRYDQKKFSRLLKDLDVSYAKVKKVYGVESGVVFFENEDQLQKGKEKLVTHTIEGTPLRVEEPKEKPSGAQIKPAPSSKPVQTAEEVVTPWFKIPYEEQLKKKDEEMLGILKSITKQIKFPKDRSIALPKWINNVQSNSPCCNYLGIKPAPVIDRYRNKTELTIGKDVSGALCVGYLLGAFKDGHGTCTGSPVPCMNTPIPAIAISSQFEKFIESSQYQPYTKIDHTGLWRLLTIRTTGTKQSQAVLQMNPTGLPKEEVDELISSLRKFVESTAPAHVNVNVDQTTTTTETTTTTTTETTTTTTTTDLSASQNSSVRLTPPLVDSFYVQMYSGISNAAGWDCPYQHVFGETNVFEQILGLKFRISPASFLQVNIPATEVLYSLIGEWAGLNGSDDVAKNTILLDICCGAGTIGLPFASKVAKLIGIEIVESAVQDAIFNANLNNVTNATFIAGKAEEVLKTVLKNHLHLPHTDSPNVVAIVDPPRSGLHPDTLRAIRNCTFINTLVYVSCKQTSLINDSVLLCKAASNRNQSPPFVPIKAMAVDMFPHTPHCELVMLLEREKPVLPTDN